MISSHREPRRIASLVVAGACAALALTLPARTARGQVRAAPPKPVSTSPALLPPPSTPAPPKAGLRATAPSMDRQQVPSVPVPDPLPAAPPPPATSVDTVVRGARPAPPPPEVAVPVAPQARSSARIPEPSVSRSAEPPIGASMQCKDGTYVEGSADPGTCAARGGTAVVLPEKGPPPPPPRARRP